jgi:hypothetical protein
MGTSKHPVRQTSETAGTGQPTGVGVPNSLEDAAADRVSEEQSGDTSSPIHKSEGGRGTHNESIRGSEGLLLPVRQEREAVRAQETEGSYVRGDQSRPSGNCSASGPQPEEDAKSIGSGSDGASQKGDRSTPRTSGEDGSFREGSSSLAQQCFIKDKPCNALCMAYAGNDVKPQCRILNFMDRLTVVLKRPSERPIAPPPPGPRF